jgi:serine/threonine protein kinase
MVDDVTSPLCPDEALLARWAAGETPPKQFADHLSSCTACRQALHELGDEERLAGQLRGALDLERQVAMRRALEIETAGDYEVIEPLGRGGHGVVFKARDLKLNRPVAIKCLYSGSGDERAAAVLQEARHLARINHPGIAAIYAVSPNPQVPFIVMELVDGRPITEAMAGRPISEQIEAFRGALQGAAELHRRGLVHRDLKPGNILLDRDGKVKLVDLGIAHAAEAFDSGRIEGTPAYLAPEQSFGEPAHPAADVFSLGVILFELLTGQRPFPGQTQSQVITSIRQADPPLPRSLREEIPGALQAICLTALEKDPGRRYPSAGRFLLDIERFLRGEAVSADPKLLVTVLEHGIDRHVADLQRWRSDRLISTREFDYLAARYGLLRQREEFWVLDSRRISFSQVILHLGVWACVVSGFLMLAFPWPNIGITRTLLPSALVPVLLGWGMVLWQHRTKRVAVVLLIGAVIACPIAVATDLSYFRALGGQSSKDILEGMVTNRQLLAGTLSGLALGLALWQYTRAAAFSLASGLMSIAVASALFGLVGLRVQLEQGRADIVAGWYLWPGILLLGVAMAWDLRWRIPSFAAPLYAMGMVLAILSLTLIAGLGPTPVWLGWTAASTGPEQIRLIKYSFMFNGVLYLVAGLLASRSTRSSSLRRIGTVLLWLAPSHILIPILRLENDWAVAGSSWTIPEFLLLLGALGFIFASVPRQMKSLFFSGLFYLAISVQRLTARHFENIFAWPLGLAAAGSLLALLAWRHPALFDQQARKAKSESAEAIREDNGS